MDKGTIVRTVLLGVTWLNILLVNYNLQPVPVLDEESIAYGLTFLASVWAWFKNNYITLRGKQQKEVLEKSNLMK
ncbi:phage holin [Virgibacillus proomii]|jgi:SPP1 family holin|uniref:phage holin n=1 Tax=Virgibacillus proomii TaxID=84407 RepID=UPI000985646D|nr:phage holin [Virgibacillus proomii]